MPVSMFRPRNLGDSIMLSWDESYDFQGDSIQYTLDISNSQGFDNILYHVEGISDNEHAVKGLKSGHYYWRLGIKDSKGNTQSPFDFGVQDFYIN